MNSLLAFMLCIPSVLSFAAEPLFETTCIFPITPKNKPNYRIPSIIQAPNGAVLIICERRNDGVGDIGNHDIVMKRSTDKGRTWSEEQLILDDEDRVCTDLTVGIERDAKKLWLFFLRDKKKYHHRATEISEPPVPRVSAADTTGAACTPRAAEDPR